MFTDKYEYKLELSNIYRAMNVYMFESIYPSSFPACICHTSLTR